MNDPAPEPQITHPEEMRATASLRIGGAVTLQATARATPAGLVAAAILVGVVLLSTAAVVRAARGGKVSRERGYLPQPAE
ncbi:hypothetical protein RQ831_05455 [Roseomonas gilardii]|uniref:Uncharacterized protein n=1 Tax=Roseomonas gilardii TaxID=257708 RepID=A0ABU3MCB4_9PROT|nr:hypothetical protein [Roseomonas gilardii]MDT8330492.1 hypothetical protein [Roseomonas gilardii]